MAPKGINMDPPTAVGRYLGCEHRVYDKETDWQGAETTALDPPPPKVKKEQAATPGPVSDESLTMPLGAAAAHVGHASLKEKAQDDEGYWNQDYS